MADQARRRPGATAVVAGDATLAYGELDQSANRLARYLTSLGAGPETLVGACLERGAEAIRGLLAIMKAGSGYLPPAGVAAPPTCSATWSASGGRLLNAYGLTETTITSALFDVSAHPEALAPGGLVPVGRPGTRIVVLDEDRAPVPAGTGSGCTERVMPDAGVPAASWR